MIGYGGLVRRSDAWRIGGQDLHTCLVPASSTHAYTSLSVLDLSFGPRACLAYLGFDHCLFVAR